MQTYGSAPSRTSVRPAEAPQKRRPGLIANAMKKPLPIKPNKKEK